MCGHLAPAASASVPPAASASAPQADSVLSVDSDETLAEAAAFLTACPLAQYIAPQRLQKSPGSLAADPGSGLRAVGQNACRDGSEGVAPPGRIKITARDPNPNPPGDGATPQAQVQPQLDVADGSDGGDGGDGGDGARPRTDTGGSGATPMAAVAGITAQFEFDVSHQSCGALYDLK